MSGDPAPAPNVVQAVPILPVWNIGRSMQYYTEGVGFTKTVEWTKDGRLHWCRLQHGEAALMLKQIEHAGHPAWISRRKVADGVGICFLCTDALAVYREVISRGIEASKPFVGHGNWVTYLTDPDGFGISFESRTEVREGTEYSEDGFPGNGVP